VEKTYHLSTDYSSFLRFEMGPGNLNLSGKFT
jgi:hypothetical protein